MSTPEQEAPDAFTHLSTELRQALSDRGFSTPTAPQQAAIPTLATGTDALVIAPTGTGKTESAMLPVFSQLVEDGDRFGFGALLVTPLRALNRDMLDRLNWWGDQLDLDIEVRHGDTTDYQRQQQANDPPDVLITTPETIQAMLTGSKLREALTDLDYVVVDEIHELVGSKRGAQLTIALERLRALAGPYQRIGLSATVGDPDAVARFLTGDREYEILDCGQHGEIDVEVRQPVPTDADRSLAQELATDGDIASHVRVIADIVEDNESTLIFVNTRTTAEGLGSRLKEYGVNLGIHHGSLAKESRIQVEDEFKAGELDALLCTSSMELGIDVGRIDHVVQYQSPRQVRRFLQRIGRAGHTRHETSHGTIVTSNTDDTLESLIIARKAVVGDVEPERIHHGSLDTVANQIVGLAMERGEIAAMEAYDLITHAYPFQELTESQFKEIVEELSQTRILWVDREEDLLTKRDGSWQYFYGNLSMIPDEAKYSVVDIASDRQIGSLDERFVVDFAAPGEIFIQRGEMWRISEIDEDDAQIKVAPVEDPTAEAPSWTGQEIPVPYSVAQDVGAARARIAKGLVTGEDEDTAVTEDFEQDVAEDIADDVGQDVAQEVAQDVAQEVAQDVAQDVSEEYPASPETIEAALTQLRNHDEVVPSDDRIVVEYQHREICLNACFGHKINETLGRLLTALVGQRTGSSVGLETDPYRIILDVPSGISGTDVLNILRDTDPDHLAAILELSLKRTDALKFKLSQVSKKFGRIKEWRGSGGRTFSSGRLLDALVETPAFDEAVREFMHEELAVEETKAVLERLQAGDIDVSVVGTRTSIGTGGRSGSGDILSPENADAGVIQTVRDRIRTDRMKLFCVHCQDWERTTRIERIDEQPSCPNCESTMIAALNPWADEVVSAVRQPEKSESEEKDTQKAYRTASLVQSHGKKAIIALAGRGVGPENAARIINNHRESEDEFYRDILRREREYARTNAFWD